LQLALKGYQDNITAEVTQGLNRFGSGSPALQADATILDQAQKAQCSTQPVGP
jgi:hypothetical protein